MDRERERERERDDEMFAKHKVEMNLLLQEKSKLENINNITCAIITS